VRVGGRVRALAAPQRTSAPIQRRFGARSARLALALCAFCAGLVAIGAITDGARAAAVAPSPTPTASTSPRAESDLQALIAAANFPELRWPSFPSYRTAVGKFYASRGYSLAWVSDGQASAQALAMIQLFKQASMKGLDPEDYDASRWDARLARIRPASAEPSETDLVHFDLALTVCAMRFISDLHVGRVNPQHIDFGLVGPNQYDLSEFVANHVLPAQNVDSVVASVEPQYAGYQRAEAALASYVKLAAQGDGTRLPMPVKSVRPVDTYPSIPQLAWRLHQLGDLPDDPAIYASMTTYNGAVVDAVKHFQRRHGLEHDGILGQRTIVELNTPLGQRVVQLKLALERYRWIPATFPQPPIVINLPEFRLRTMRRQPGGFLSMEVVVGKAYGHQTPVLASYVRYIVFRPYWDVPFSIQRAELIPKIRRDPDYLAKNGYEVVSHDRNVVTDGTVTDDVLAGLRSGELYIRQKPGPKNALGLVKFIFPNPYDVYLHSTPATELFSRARRDFSHGCIRVEDPAGLAAWMLRDNPTWSAEAIRAAMNDDQTIQVNLDKPIPVLILYSTAVVEPDGEVHFFRDIYGLDAELEKALTVPVS
jgi:L,D-transpeptidase YcbB